MKTLSHFLKASVCALACGLLLPVSSVALADEPYFEGKRINVIIRSNPGGGYDFHGRLIARHIGKHIPGNPSVVAENRPGAGGVVAANYLFQQAPSDGTAILIAARELALAERLGEAGVSYQTLEMPALGSTASDSRIWVAGEDSPVRNLDDLRDFDRDFVFAVSGTGAGAAQMVQLLDLAGYPVRVVTGYEGTGSQILAILRGEVDAQVSTFPAQRDVVADESLTIIAKLGNHPELDQMGVQDVRDVLTGDYRALANVLGGPLVAGRPFFTAPGTPDDVVQILRDASRATMDDPEFIRELEASGEEVGYTSPEEMEELYRETLNAPDHIVDLFRDE